VNIRKETRSWVLPVRGQVIRDSNVSCEGRSIVWYTSSVVGRPFPLGLDLVGNRGPRRRLS
jgi:hypothetical protein